MDNGHGQLDGRWALVTGASGGIGADLAAVLAEKKCNLVLAARSESKLQEVGRDLTAKHGVEVRVVPKDLSLQEGPKELHEYVTGEGLTVDFLLNNAGLGSVGPTLDTPWERHEAMIVLNVRALLHLSWLFLPQMISRDSGRILNMASLAAFQPMPGFASYAATKSFVLHLTEALSVELAGTNVRVSALCPGFTRTDFWETAGSQGNWFRKQLTVDSRGVAEYGVRLMLAGRPVGIPGLINKFVAFSNRLGPRRLSARIAQLLMKE